MSLSISLSDQTIDRVTFPHGGHASFRVGGTKLAAIHFDYYNTLENAEFYAEVRVAYKKRGGRVGFRKLPKGSKKATELLAAALFPQAVQP